MSDTVKKYALVVFLTILVWAWADKAIEKSEDYSASLAIAQTTDEDLLVTFDKMAPIDLEIVVKGPSSKINKLKNLIDTGREKLDFVYSPKNNQPETYTSDIVKLLNQTEKIKNLGLIVDSSEPASIEITLEKLVKRQLEIQCFDEYGRPRLYEVITPPTVGIFVKKNYVGKATINLTPAEIDKAQKEPITKKPYVQLPSGELRYGEDVAIKLPSTELPTQNFQPSRIGFVLSEGLQGQYNIILSNRKQLIETITFKASDEAYKAYENSPFHIIVLVLNDDKNEENEISGDIIYNFPSEYLAEGKIELVEPPIKARFRLIPIKPPVPEEPSAL